jgi:hypothetical protein
MTNKLKEHLIRWEKAMQSAKPILAKHGFADRSPHGNRHWLCLGAR